MEKIERSCWFYDNQLLDRMTCVSLHANSYFDLSQPGRRKWKKFEKVDGIDAGGYCKTPLVTSILTEDFQVNVANTWTDVGGDAIGEAYNRAIKPFSPYAQFANSALKKMGNEAEKWLDNNGDDKTIAQDIGRAMKSVGNWAEKHGEDIVDYMNSSLISQGTRFKYYSGTGVSFGNLQMRFTMFPIWTSEGTFLSVPQQLENLFPYVMGEYSDLYLGITKKDDKGRYGIKVEEHGDGTADSFSTLLGWQHPPGGYQANYKDIDVEGLKGTLKLRIGAFYVLESLVCESMNFNLSRQMVKRPSEASFAQINKQDYPHQIEISPLSADVTMSFVPATKYSDQSMKNFIYGLNTAGDDNEGVKEANKQLVDNLSAIKEDIKKTYNP